MRWNDERGRVRRRGPAIVRWALVATLLSTGACQCGEVVDETGKKAAEEFTGHGTVKRGRKVAKEIEDSLKEAEQVRDQRADEILKQGKSSRRGQ